MAIIGISGSPIINGNIDRLTKAILNKSGKEYEFINLSTLNFAPCRGCAHLCAPTGMCGRNDDALPYIKKVKDAEAIVLSSPIHGGGMTAWMHSFLSRLWCLSHIHYTLKDRPVVLVSAGLSDTGTFTGREIYEHRFLGYEHLPKVIGELYYSTKTPPCFTCGEGLNCTRGGLWVHCVNQDAEALKNFKITPDKFRKWEDDSSTVKRVEECAKALSVI